MDVSGNLTPREIDRSATVPLSDRNWKRSAAVPSRRSSTTPGPRSGVPGSETTDRIVKTDQYAKSGIAFYWRVEQAAPGVPLV